MGDRRHYKPRQHDGFKAVREIEDGGTGIPVPLYLITYKGEVLWGTAKAREAIDYLAERGRGWACLVSIDGETREVCRNPATLGGTT